MRLAFCLLLLCRTKPLTTTIVFSLTLPLEDFKEKALLTWELTSADTVKLEFPSAKYPETAQHIKQAIATGKSSVCTIDRDGANHNRDLSLKGVPTKKGKDRDEWPMAMCAEGGEGADIKYISPKDNRGAGSLVGHKLEEYKDGTKVEFIIK
ncbi:Sporulation-specific extracellular nuclease precursor [compost metagenome]